MMKRSTQRIISTVLLFILSLTFFVAIYPAHAETGPFYWNRIDVNLDVQTNGDMWVTERQEYVFQEDYPNQRYRYIPLEKVDAIKDVTVQENNQLIPSETGIENNQLWIRWNHPLNPPETHTFVLKYRVVGGLQVNDQDTQVYWKAVFADRKASVQNAKVLVKLPEALTGKVTGFTSFGAGRDRQVDPRTVEFSSTKPIPPQQEFEVQVSFPNEILNLSRSSWQGNTASGRNSSVISQESSSGSLYFFGFIIFLVILITFIWGGGGGNGSSGGSYTSYNNFSGGSGGGGGGG
jgi:hypothetical protein